MHPQLSSKYLLSIFFFAIMSFATFKSDAQTVTKYIVTDQFGYLPSSRKIAVIRDPQVGFDASESFTPGATYALVNTATGVSVYSAAPVSWNNGATDASSGDKAWWFDFSSVTASGTYFVLDVDKGLRSFAFEIAPNVYNNVLKHAVRSFFYQRAGFEKKTQFAGPEWADGASHLGALQDKNARPYTSKTSSSKELSLYGAWYDAGDYHRYTNWTANYVTDFMRAYIDAPSAWADNYNIPESGNGVPDLLDEAKWGLDHLLRMQQSNGSVLSLLNVDHASPPSSAAGQSVYTPASTSATLNTGAAFAAASKVYASIGMNAYSDTLKARAIKAWDWALTNSGVTFFNQPAKLGGGEQETDDYGRLTAKMELALYLFEITGDVKYKTYFEANYKSFHLILWNNYGSAFELTNQEILLYYAKLPGATPSVANEINNAFKIAMNGNDQFKSYSNYKDPYVAYLSFYGWGTNSVKSLQGLMFNDVIRYNIDPTKNDTARKASEAYIHYIHGVNPLNIVYLSNMYKYGGENCVNEFYHTWFGNGSPKWDRVGVSTYGPAPGYLTGGANPGYNWDASCPSQSGCNGESITPPKGQPNQKSYKDFNTSWPLNSWEVTENSCSYQINYIRLLSQFIVATNYDCNGTKDGTAVYDMCNRCTGGTTGLTPVTNSAQCLNVTATEAEKVFGISVYPNPSEGIINIKNETKEPYSVSIISPAGKQIINEANNSRPGSTYSISNYPAGLYVVVITFKGQSKSYKIIKN